MSFTTVLDVFRELRAVLASRPHLALTELAAPDPITGERVLFVTDADEGRARPITATIAIRWVGDVRGYIQVKLLGDRDFLSQIWRRTPPPYDAIATCVDERVVVARAMADRRAALDAAEDADRQRLDALLPLLGPKSVRLGRATRGRLSVDVILRPKTAADLDAVWNLLSVDERFRARPAIWLRVTGLTVPRLEDLLKAGQPHLRAPIESRFTPKRATRRGASRTLHEG